MKSSDMILLLVLFGLLAAGTYVWFNIPIGEQIELKQTNSMNASASGAAIDNNKEYANSTQFYPNMRYRDKKITYSIEANCTQKKQKDIEYALTLLSSRTFLTFTPSKENPELRYLCSNIAPDPEEEGHFVAGEGGPSEIINTSAYAVIFTGKVSLYRPEICEEPKIALHETLHALGFDHSNNPESIMYPVTNCNQIVDQYIIDEINDLYKVDSAPDLSIEKVNASTKGRYLDFSIVVVNIGLKDTTSAMLSVFANGDKVKDFDLEEIEIGSKKSLAVENLRLPSAEKVTLQVQSNVPSSEITLKNNKVELSLA